MPFQPSSSQPDITVARNYLAQSPIKTKDPALFQSIDNLIRWLQNYQQSVQITINSSGADISGLVAIITQILTGTFLTSTDQTSFLANSRELLAGSGITFDDSTPGERTVEASGSAGDTATYLTEDDESATLPNSRQVLAGDGIAFDDSVANERTISASNPIVSIIFQIDGAGAAITPAVINQYRYIREELELIGWSLQGDISGDAEIDVFVNDPDSTYPPTSSIVGAVAPELNTQAFAKSSGLAGWTTTIPADSVIGIELVSAATVEFLTVQLDFKRML